MLTIETERRVTKLLLALSQGELSCLLNRHCLVTHREFNAFQCFKQLDHKGKEYIDAYDIVDFLKKHNTYSTIDEANMIILFYDRDNSQHITYRDFFTILYSGIGFDQSSLHEPASLTSEPLSSSVEYLQYKVFNDELRVIREIRDIMQCVINRYDFNVFDLFKAMEGRECLTEHNLFVFLKRNGRQLSKEEMGALFNRLNIEKSGGISLREVKLLFDSYSKTGFKAKDTWKDYDDRHLTTSLNIFKHSMNISSETNKSTVLSTKASLRSDDNDNDKRRVNHFLPEFPLKPVSLEESYRDELMISKAKYDYEQLNPPEYKEIYELIKMILDTEKMIEQSKCELALRADFNIEDAFSIFASNKGINYITDKELSYGLSSLNIQVTDDDIKMLIHKYDLSNDGVISYKDLFDMFIPFTKEYRTMVEMRLPANYSPKYNRTDVFLNATKLYLRSLLRTIITQERSILSMKQTQQPLYRLYIEKIFKQIDFESNGYITSKKLGIYLKDHHIILTQPESDLLFMRLDNKRKGRVYIKDFIREFYMNK